MEMLAYFQALSNDACREILENLCQDKDKEDYTENSRRTPIFLSSADASKSESEKVEHYNMLMQEKHKAEVAKKYGNKNVPSHELQSGLLIISQLKLTRTLATSTSSFVSMTVDLMQSCTRKQGIWWLNLLT